MTPEPIEAASETVTNSVTWNDVNIENGEYFGIWDSFRVAIPFEKEDYIFEVESENCGEITTCLVYVYDKMARVNRNKTELNKKANYDGSITNEKLTLINKKEVQ